MNDAYNRVTCFKKYLQDGGQGYASEELQDAFDLVDRIDELEKELKAIRKDATRYRGIKYLIINNLEPDYTGKERGSYSSNEEELQDFDKVADSAVRVASLRNWK